MNILYLHGFASKFEPESDKIKTLGELGAVSGFDIDYTLTPDQIFGVIETHIHNTEQDYDVIVGTSLGGYFAAMVGARLGIPFVAINPSIDPAISLQASAGEGRDWSGKKYVLEKSTISLYKPFTNLPQGFGLILLDRGDDVFDNERTFNVLSGMYEVSIYNGGSHRFEHMKEALPQIASLYRRSVSYI